MFIFIFLKYAGMSPDCIAGMTFFFFYFTLMAPVLFSPLRFFHLLQNVLGEIIPFHVIFSLRVARA